MGWSLAAKAPIAVPIVLNFFVGVATGNLTTGKHMTSSHATYSVDARLATIYGIDLFPGQGGAVTATVCYHRHGLESKIDEAVQPGQMPFWRSSSLDHPDYQSSNGTRLVICTFIRYLSAWNAYAIDTFEVWTEMANTEVGEESGERET